MRILVRHFIGQKFSSCRPNRISNNGIITRRLVVTNRSHVSIRGRWNKNFPHTQFDHHAKSCCCFSYCMCAHGMYQKFWWMLGPAPLGYGRTWPLETCFSSKCITPNFVTLVRTVWHWGPNSLEWGCGWPPRYNFFPPVLPCYHAKFGHYRSNRTSIIVAIHHKILTPCVPPFKVTHGNNNSNVVMWIRR